MICERLLSSVAILPHLHLTLIGSFQCVRGNGKKARSVYGLTDRGWRRSSWLTRRWCDHPYIVYIPFLLVRSAVMNYDLLRRSLMIAPISRWSMVVRKWIMMNTRLCRSHWFGLMVWICARQIHSFEQMTDDWVDGWRRDAVFAVVLWQIWPL